MSDMKILLDELHLKLYKLHTVASGFAGTWNVAVWSRF